MEKKCIWCDAFIETLRITGNVRRSCEAAGVSRKVAYQRRNESPAFAKRWDDALEDACDELEEVARSRAKESSDTLLMFLLKAHRPGVYRETVRNEHTGADGGAIQIEAADYRVAVAALAPGSMDDTPAPRKGEGPGHGETVG